MTEHNFLQHYILGEEKPFEFKTINITKSEDITIFKVSFNEHYSDYNFHDADALVEEFLLNAKSRFKPKNKDVFKCDFSIENIQNAPLTGETLSDLTNTRYWSTNVYEGFCFNDYIIAEIRSDILKRVIVNGLTGSSWRFNRFKHLSLKILDKNKIIHHG